jgi:hypothetical protein
LHDGDGDRGVPLMAALPLMDQGAHAAEAATGVYLLGSRGPNAGITPPPGVYFQDDTYFYSGKIGGGGTTLPLGGLLLANVSATTWINLPTTLWVTPLKLFGGDLAFSLTTPFGDPRVNANLLVNSPRLGPIGINATDANFDMSDLFLNSFVGWHSGIPLAAWRWRRHSVGQLCLRSVVQCLAEPACHQPNC